MNRTSIDVSLNRARFRHRWNDVWWFMLLVVLATVPLLIQPRTPVQGTCMTIALSTVVGLVGGWFLRREGILLCDVGLDRRRWLESGVLFALFVTLVTLVDLLGSWLSGRFGMTLSPAPIVWSWERVLEWGATWVFVGFAEEIAFRGYLHNKLVALCRTPWQGAALGALLFGLWHVPGKLLQGSTLVAALLNVLIMGLFSFLMLNLTYEWTGVLPFLALFHGWNDFSLLLTTRASTVVGSIGGFVVFVVLLWAYTRWRRRSSP